MSAADRTILEPDFARLLPADEELFRKGEFFLVGGASLNLDFEDRTGRYASLAGA